MAYRLAGTATEYCSCSTPCPCAFGQAPDNGKCHGLMCFDIREGDVEGTSVAGTRALLVTLFGPEPWTAGGWSAAVVIDAKASDEQRGALKRALSGELGGDLAMVGGLVKEIVGVFEAPIDVEETDGRISFRAGDVAQGSGAVLKNLDGTATINVTNAHYAMPSITAGRSERVMANVGKLSFDFPGTGMWTGPFELKG